MNRYQLILTNSAEKDLDEIADYIEFDLREPLTAKRQIERLWLAIQSLENYPVRHPIVMDSVLAVKGYRIFPVDNYQVFYLAAEEDKIVSIIRILHARRAWNYILDSN